MATATAPTTNFNDLYFQCPTVTAKVYITKGPSGWPETFLRTKADAELAAFIKPAPVDDLVKLFIEARSLTRTPTDWHTIVGYLGRTMGCSPKTVPHTVGIAFWGRIVVASLEHGAN
jgi:hypothetical protein